MLKGLRITAFVILFISAPALKAEILPAGSNYAQPTLPAVNPCFQYATPQLWEYLRLGLAYLESPRPDDPPETVDPAYLHPDMCGFGTYGLTPEAYADVQRTYAEFRAYGWKDVLSSTQLYESANRAFADLLLKNLQDYIPEGASREQIFDLLQKAWNLGLNGFKNGKEPIGSRIRRAEEFKTSMGNIP
jgi:hypothetical protein